VVKGDQLGRTLGYPTANIELDSPNKLIPVDGIYAVSIQYGHQRYKGMLYIGNRPTIDGLKKSIEANIFDFNQDIYGDRITVHLHQKIRDDQKFDSLEQLIYHMDLDKEKALNLLG
jgi:riboflavin kinase/FMN adenylyltransferase